VSTPAIINVERETGTQCAPPFYRTRTSAWMRTFTDYSYISLEMGFCIAGGRSCS
jgi:hypothetical protein